MKANPMKLRLSMIALAVAFGVPLASHAQTGAVTPGKDPHAGHHPANAKTGAAEYAEAEVRKVDKEAGKITLKHGPIPNLDMPPMSMVFRAKDPAMLDAVKAGDKVRFKAEKVQGAYTVTELQPAK